MLNCPHNRRKSLKASAAGAAGAMIGGITPKKAHARGQQVLTIWEDGMQINSEIDNKRVVFCHDSEMVTDNPISWDFEGQNDPVNTEKVQENLDKMAVALAAREVTDPNDLATNAADAWATIFQKPEGKEWSEVTAAIKLVTVSSNLPKLAVVDKICQALIGLGVPPAGITIFDGGNLNHGEQNRISGNRIVDYQSDYGRAGLPEGVEIVELLGSDYGTATLPNGEEVLNSPDLLNFDIMVNLAVNKAHSMFETGKITLTMKNHLGTLSFQHKDTTPDNLELFVNFAKSIDVLGDGLPPRQQLCIIDGLWGNRTTHVREGDSASHCMLMGTFSPVVDYQTVRKIRENEEFMTDVAEMNDTIVNGFLTEFGYNPDDLTDDDWVDALAYEPQIISVKGGKSPAASNISVAVSIPARPAHIIFSAVETGSIAGIRIYTMLGKMLRSFKLAGNRKNYSITWDGKDSRGESVPSGTYVIELNAGRHSASRRVSLL
jgi:hypothetical protein